MLAVRQLIGAGVLMFAGAGPAVADRDAERSVAARAVCERLGLAGDREKLRACCGNNVPTQARQADLDKYTAICMNAPVKPAPPRP